MTAPALKGIDHVHVFVADRAAALAWYGRVLGLRPVPELEFWAADGGPLTLTDGTGAIHLALFERPAQSCRSTVAFGVAGASFAAWRRHLEAELGGPLVVQDHGVSWSVYFADPDHNPYEITTFDLDAARGAGARVAP